MASRQRIKSPLTGDISYRVQVRVKGHAGQSETFPNRKEAAQWAQSIEAAIREGRHFPHAGARRTSFDTLARDYIETVLAAADEAARDACAAETFRRSKPRKDRKTGEMIAPKEYRRSGATVNRYMAALSQLFSFAMKERRLLDRNPVSD